MRVIYIDVCNLTIPRRPAACRWVVCLKNKPSYTQAGTQEGFLTLPAFVGNTKHDILISQEMSEDVKGLN